MPRREQPNILFVFADQLRYSGLGCDGNMDARTPVLDQMARDGVVFDEAFASCPICSPYRGNLLTGRYAHANGVVCNQYRLFDGQTTLAMALGQAGYRTAYIGKWHLGYGPYPAEKRDGFDDLMGYNCRHDYYHVEYHANEAGPFKMGEYAPFHETQMTLDWIQAHLRRDRGRPFCAVLSWGPPHWTFGRGEKSGNYAQYPYEYKVFDPAKLVVPGNVPAQFRAFAREELADYYGMTLSLDDCMGRLLAALDEWGLADNTLVCFSSDHGDHLSAHGYGKPGDGWMDPSLRCSKATPFEESIHIPFLLRWPAAVPRMRRTATLFNSVDVMPTLLGLAGLPAPAGVQGHDLSHAALGTPGFEPDSVFLQIEGPGWPDRTKFLGLWRGVRTARYTYARWHDLGGRRWLFDRHTDPLEMKNLIDDPAHAQAAEALEARLQQWLRETGDPFDTGARLPDTEMLDLGQRLTCDSEYAHLPPNYRRALLERAT